jgi:phospholipid/cholesterol/gamma-HCH transport system substrate-binding protein
MSKSAIAVRGPLIKTVIFTIATLLVLLLVSAQLGQWRFYGTDGYTANFVNASELQEGDPVLLNGVKIGKVSDVAVGPNYTAQVTFDVKSSLHLTRDTRAFVRFRNLTGDRFLELAPGDPSGPTLSKGQEIPLAQTQPALDLDMLLGGLKPLFQGLDPDQINQFSQELVTVLQGQGGNVESILSHIASVGRTISEKDDVIASTIDNLNSVLGNLDDHSVELSGTVDQLQNVASALSKDRGRIGRSLESVDKLTGSLGNLTQQLRGPLDSMVEQLGRATRQANAGSQTMDQVLRMLPGVYLRLGRLASRGAGYSIYVCALRAMIDGPNGKPLFLPWIGPGQNVARCQKDTAPLEMPDDPATATGSQDTSTEAGAR